MPQVQYPFIDIAVHPDVRERFAAGEAIVLFSEDMNDVLWANGRGAKLFGEKFIYDLLDNGPDRNGVAFRQLSSAVGQLAGVGDRLGFAMRVASGFRSTTTPAEVSRIAIRPGETVIMFSAPMAAGGNNPEHRYSAMLEGFDDPDTHMAVLDGEGRVLAASPRFATLGISEATAKSLIVAADRDADRLIKRPIPSGAGYLPAAIGKLSDQPSLNLMFCVETVLGLMDPPEADAISAPAEPVFALAEPEDHPVVESIPEWNSVVTDQVDIVEALPADAAADVIELPETLVSEVAADGMTAEPVAEETDAFPDSDIQGEAPQADDVLDDVVSHAVQREDDASAEMVAADEAVADEPFEPVAQAEDVTETAADIIADAAATAPQAHETIDAESPLTSEPFRFEPQNRPIRFVWKLGADGRFSEVSPEFARTVGPVSGDINGKSFALLAEDYGFDPNGEIRGLLERRDTWSGRTIRWPIEGTNLMVPVDLAALPTYSRNREFDGFRGFGIIRVNDAEIDNRAIGLSIAAVTGGEASEAFDITGDGEPVVNASIATEEEPVADDGEQMAGDSGFDHARPDEDVMADTPDPFAGEVPVFAATNEVPPLVPGLSEKVVLLEERRAKARDGLSQAEQAAFREIARQLETVGRPFEDGDEVDGDFEQDDDFVSVMEEVEAAPVSASDEEQPGPSTEEGEAEQTAHSATDADVIDLSDRERGLTAASIDMVPLAILIHAGDDLIAVNAEFRRLTGYDGIAALQAAGGLDALILRREGEEAGVYLIRADGTQSPVSARLQSIRYEGVAALLLALVPIPSVAKPVVDDGADRRRLAALSVEVDELRSILETATDGVVLLDTEGRIRSMNRSASALFNYDDAEINGRPFAMLFAHESQRAVQDYLAGLAGHGVASVLNDGREVIGREASGGFIPMFMTMGRMPGSDSYCAVIRDITQWKRSEEELRAAKRSAETANQHKSDFLARVSHEIRTPLNAIIGFSDMIASEHFGPAGHARYVEYAADIGRSGRHVLDIVNDLLDISKIEAGEMDLDFVAVGLNDCISEAVSLLQPQANTQRVIVRTSLSQSVPNVVADLRSVKQIAINILANAIRFTQPGGQIVVSTAYEPSGSVSLKIRDTGVGMSRAELEQAMKPFGQVSPGSRKRGDGTGLGLPLTKAMTEANRALFSIHSAPNEGTLVEITFPPQRVLAN
ncbi:PAS domain-containing sensor histidine kinase [Rhizobium alvei]|uniref:histidine kinase n=1 Tax=Rhizobium alvei TaxID=1132659 RepID=A0ABT8YMC4_9HYPH|nr:PAS domain S-box protein [Rhizobium alvei]MDO6964656.1 PAS domain S-box protein [Rhizobium alvei]